jgi:epoxyqueuosine reductase
MIATMGLELTVKQRAIEIGFDLAGIAPPGAWRDLEFSRSWVERGYGGEMRYLANPQRDDPRQLLPSVKSVVSVGLVYNAALPYSTEAGKDRELRDQKPESSRQKAIGRGQNSEQGAPNAESCRAKPGTVDNQQRSADDSPRGWISRYAWGQDYHEVMRARLELLRKAIEELAPGVETRVYVDTGPIVERAFARLSGIGWMGKNTCLINDAKGSWFFLGVALTSLELEPDLPAPDRCGSCTSCLEACPTGALVEPYVMDASRCISYFTIELKGSIPETFRARIGANVFGCDICQDVCPWNSRPGCGGSVVSSKVQGASGRPLPDSLQGGASNESSMNRGRGGGRPAITNDPAFQAMTVAFPRASNEYLPSPDKQTTDNGPGTTDAFSLLSPPLEALAWLTEDDFRRLFAHSPIKRVKYRGWLRNLCVVMGNSGDPRFVPWLERLAQDDDPVLREHAMWALGCLKQS